MKIICGTATIAAKEFKTGQQRDTSKHGEHRGEDHMRGERGRCRRKKSYADHRHRIAGKHAII
jgi:hypothetical protein